MLLESDSGLNSLVSFVIDTIVCKDTNLSCSVSFEPKILPMCYLVLLLISNVEQLNWMRFKFSSLWMLLSYCYRNGDNLVSPVLLVMNRLVIVLVWNMIKSFELIGNRILNGSKLEALSFRSCRGGYN